LGWSLRVELKPEVVFSPAFTPRLKQESSKVVRVFNTVVIVVDRVHLSPSCGGERKSRRPIIQSQIKGGNMESKHNIKNVVLVHGAFADGSGWEAVANILKNDGYKVSVAQPPETSYAEDQKSTKAAIDAMGGPVVLVGHSYGGSIITEAGNHPNVLALVYIAAFALDEGESCASIEQGLPQASKAFKPDSNNNWWIEQEHFAADFAADVPPEKAWFMAISQVPISGDSFTHKVTSPAWKTKPTWYMVATADRSINPDQERMMAKRAKAKTIEVNASHVAYMSHPKETAKLIEEAATSAVSQVARSAD
jgi:pimeloyl-ACP methyl ester carboxylesterase